MNKNTGDLDHRTLSSLIGEIYDCVIDPGRWEPTLDWLGDLLGCTTRMFIVADLPITRTRLRCVGGVAPEWVAKYPEVSSDGAKMLLSVPDLTTRPLDEPLVGRRDIGAEVLRSSRYWQEWVVPQGGVDFISLPVILFSRGVTNIAFGRHGDAGPITEREVRLLRQLAPHLRRAVTISDVIRKSHIESEALRHTLDMVPAGVVLVNEETEILHANRAACRMIDGTAPIRSARGKLSVADYKTAEHLREVVALAARKESEIGAAGIGMALSGHAGPPATAHVLPIAEGALRSRLMPKGAAAVFVASESARPVMNLQPVAAAFGLSRAETRVLERLVLGDSLPDAAAALCISHNTAKTHLSRLFSKTGTQRQASLVALVNKLLPPVAP